MTEGDRILTSQLVEAPEEDVVRLLTELPNRWKSDGKTGGTHPGSDWRPVETLTWELGESLRCAVRERPRLKKAAAVWDACVSLLRDSEIGRGRQPFLELVAKYAAKDPNAIAAIVASLDDDDLTGQAVKAARIARVRGLSARVRSIRESTEKAWIRREATKYLAFDSVGGSSPT